MTAPLYPDVCSSVAGHGLAGAMGAWPAEPLTDAAWDELLRAVRAQRLSGLLLAAITDGTLPTTEAQAEAASELHFLCVCDSLYLESGTVRTAELLLSAGVDVRVLKGPAVAHLDYPDPALRLFSDVDLLVRGEQFDAAVAALTGAGNRRRFPQPRPGFDRRYSKGTSFLTPDGLELDLHRTFVMGPYGLRARLEDLWTHETTFELGGRRLSALDPEMRFMHACFHSALGETTPRLVPQRDVAQMLLSGRLDLERVRHTTRRWGAAPVVARAVALTWSTLRIADITALSSWAQRYAPGARAARDLAVYTDAQGSYAAKSLAALAALPRVRDKISFAVALTFPRRSYLEGRHQNASSRWLQGVVAARNRRDAP